jgi:hypothetical protein
MSQGGVMSAQRDDVVTFSLTLRKIRGTGLL